jgi:hypothetical protein
MKIYKIGNIYVALTRTIEGGEKRGYVDYARTRMEAIEKGLEHIKNTMYHRGNLLVL